jgi:hypothetical protein
MMEMFMKAGIKKIVVLSLSSLALISFVPMESYANDMKEMSIETPVEPKKSLKIKQKLKAFFGACFGCLKETREAIEDVEEITKDLVKEGDKIIDGARVIDEIVTGGKNKDKIDNIDKVIEQTGKVVEIVDKTTDAIGDNEKLKNLVTKVEESDTSSKI